MALRGQAVCLTDGGGTRTGGVNAHCLVACGLASPACSAGAAAKPRAAVQREATLAQSSFINPEILRRNRSPSNGFFPIHYGYAMRQAETLSASLSPTFQTICPESSQNERRSGRPQPRFARNGGELSRFHLFTWESRGNAFDELREFAPTLCTLTL